MLLNSKKIFFWIVFLFISPINVFAKTGDKKMEWVYAYATGEFPIVYQLPDFDSENIQTLKNGQKIIVSRQTFNFTFRVVALGGGKKGYVSTAEIQLANVSTQKKKAELQKKKKAEEDDKKVKPLELSRFRGLSVESINFTEDTMAGTYSDQIILVGFRASGVNTLFSGLTATDGSVLFYSGVPKYYTKRTGQTASGWIFNAHFTFDTLIPVGRHSLMSYGFGPMLRYSQFAVQIAGAGTNGRPASYSLEDLNFGFLLRAGMAFRLGSLSIRPDLKYFFEGKRYWGLDIGFLWNY